MAKVVKVGPFGGSRGEAVDMGAADRLTEIKIRTADSSKGPIQGMTVTYLENGIMKTFQLGDADGVVQQPITFQDGEFLVEVSGSVGVFEGLTLITSLKFCTNFGKNYGPCGTEEGTSFSVPVLNAKIVGFFGRLGATVGAIGVNMVPSTRDDHGPSLGSKL